MINKKLIENPSISLHYPGEWKYSMEEDGTHLFFNEKCGSLRISVVLLDDPIKIDSFLTKEHKENQAHKSEWLTLGNFDFVFYNKTADFEINSTMDYYISGESNFLLICSYTYDNYLKGSSLLESELTRVRLTLESIKRSN